ncbi:SDR family NAD(P)-dependent oxidoreductase [Acrocarpospora catenulata]|uniref:SDR family NAD(P)-dependent oxidoreductase n=1 Tax=Acrocarpospora catenulata TaxID=2836182 RepID=UPI001BD9E34A|nr:SDR family oxidoreductase [Acrocarpospora catenulata]
MSLGPIALIAGASSGIGGAVARQLTRDGYRCVLHCFRNRAHVEQTAAELTGPPPLVVAGDLTDRTQVHLMAERIADDLGVMPHVVVNCVHGTPHTGDLTHVGTSDWQREAGAIVSHLNLVGEFVPAMIAAGGGCLVAVSGGLARRHAAGLGLYGAAKAAVEALTRTLALEVGAAGVRANIVAPGRLLSWQDEPGPDGDPFALLERATKWRRALPTLPRVQDVAAVVSFLVSPAGASLTGQIIDVNGGEQIG